MSSLIIFYCCVHTFSKDFPKLSRCELRLWENILLVWVFIKYEEFEFFSISEFENKLIFLFTFHMFEIPIILDFNFNLIHFSFFINIFNIPCSSGENEEKGGSAPLCYKKELDDSTEFWILFSILVEILSFISHALLDFFEEIVQHSRFIRCSAKSGACEKDIYIFLRIGALSRWTNEDKFCLSSTFYSKKNMIKFSSQMIWKELSPRGNHKNKREIVFEMKIFSKSMIRDVDIFAAEIMKNVTKFACFTFHHHTNTSDRYWTTSSRRLKIQLRLPFNHSTTSNASWKNVIFQREKYHVVWWICESGKNTRAKRLHKFNWDE